ncbi:MAG: hypothetical protein ABI625_04970 [bacterium]
MDFIERVFGLSPDGGSGLYELLVFLLPVAASVAWYFRAKRANK